MTDTTEKMDKTSGGVTIKNFKNTSEVENFYRFIHDNGLRAEAKQLVQIVLKSITPQKKRGRKKSVLQ